MGTTRKRDCMKHLRSRNVGLFTTLLMAFTITGLVTVTTPALALSDTFYVTGQDLDILMETDKTYVMEEIEYKLRKIPLFREVEDFMTNVTSTPST